MMLPMHAAATGLGSVHGAAGRAAGPNGSHMRHRCPTKLVALAAALTHYIVGIMRVRRSRLSLVAPAFVGGSERAAGRGAG
jgi:hypothetical protein